MATIAIRIDRSDQLFNSLDASTFHERTLSQAAVAHIVDRAVAYGPEDPLHIVIHAPESVARQSADITRAFHVHFDLAHDQCRRRYRQRMRLGLRTLLAACGVLAAALILRALLASWVQAPALVAIGEGLLIVGWVAMWRPVDILLYERIEEHRKMALFERLARASLAVNVENGAPPTDDKTALPGSSG